MNKQVVKIMQKWLNSPAVVEQQKLPHKKTNLEGARTYAAIGLFYDCVEEVYKLGRTDEYARIIAALKPIEEKEKK